MVHAESLIQIGRWGRDSHPGPTPTGFVDWGWDPVQREVALQYLIRNRTPISGMRYLSCQLCDVRGPDVSFTDGVFWWYSDLPHYVGMHGVRLPERVMDHIRATQVELLGRGSDHDWWDAQVEAHLQAPGRGYLIGDGDASAGGEGLSFDAGGPLRWLGVGDVVDEDRVARLESLVGWDWPRESWETPSRMSMTMTEDGIEHWSLSREHQLVLFEPGHVPGPDWALPVSQWYALQNLRNNLLLRVVEEPQACVLCGELLGCSELTDGVFIWQESLVHYVEAHAMWLPSQFMEYAERQEDELLALPLDSSWWDSLSGQPQVGQ